MGRRPKFTMAELKYEAAQVMRHIKNEIRRGRLAGPPDKTECIKLLAARPNLGLRGDRSLWDGERKAYLDEWYQRVLVEVAAILTPTDPIGAASHRPALVDPSTLALEVERLQKRVDEQNQAIAQYKKAVQALRLEVQELRATHLPTFTPIDQMGRNN